MSTILELLYAGSTLVFVLAGLFMIRMGIRAYAETARTAMLYLAVGFSLAVAGAAATMISAFLLGFDGDMLQSLLLVKSAFTTFGFLFVMYSIVIFD